MNLTLEQLYKLRHALNVAAVHDEIFVNDEVIKAVNDEIDMREIAFDTACQTKKVNSVFDNVFRKTTIG